MTLDLIDPEEACLEALQHDGQWMSLDVVSLRAGLRSPSKCYAALQTLVSQRKVESTRTGGGTMWKAVFEDVR